MDVPPTDSEPTRQVVVCVGATGHPDRLERCLRSLEAHTSADVAIVVCPADGAPPRIDSQRCQLGSSLHRTLTDRPEADVVWLSADYAVEAGWLDGLRDAAHSDSRVATASPLGQAPGRLSVSLPSGSTFQAAAAAVRRHALRLRPRLPTPGGDCCYVRRDALELVGAFEDLPAFAERATTIGLCHVAADDVLIGSDQRARPATAVPTDSPLVRGLDAARRAVWGLSIAVDARSLGGPVGGTMVHTLELLAALSRVSPRPVTAIVPDELDAATRVRLAELPGLELVAESGVGSDFHVDVVHRPFQIASPADLTFLARLADRVVLTQQDMIDYGNPSYFASPQAWLTYRELTRRALASADQVLFFSGHAQQEALTEDLVDPQRSSIVYLGADHQLAPAVSPPVRAIGRIGPDTELMLCLGADYWHKNRVFVLRLLAELQQVHGWPGLLVFAGPRVRYGSSRSEEERILAADPALRQAVLDLGQVEDGQRTWLLRRADVVVYPTVYEGFGLVPFESAVSGTPCLWARGTSLAELLPNAAGGLTPWNVPASAAAALGLLRDDQAKADNLAAVRDAGQRYSWDGTARELIDIYGKVCDQAPAAAGSLERQRGLMRDDLSEDAIRLVGPNGALPRDLERPLLAVATRSRLARPLFAALRAGYRVAARSRPER